MSTPTQPPESHDQNDFIGDLESQLHALLSTQPMERHPEIATTMFGETTMLDSFRLPTDEAIALIAETIRTHPDCTRRILIIVGGKIEDTCCNRHTSADVRHTLSEMTLRRIIEKMATLPRPKRGKTQPGQAVGEVIGDTRKAVSES